MSHDVDRRRGTGLSRRSAGVLAALGSAVGIAATVFLAKPMTIETGDIILFPIAGPLVSQTITNNIQGPGSSSFFQNQPSGWTQSVDYDFSDSTSVQHPGTSTTTGTLGPFSVDLWGGASSEYANGPSNNGWGFAPLDEVGQYSGGGAYAEHYPGDDAHAGRGTETMRYSMPGGNQPNVYVSAVIKYDAGFTHNTVSEKMFFFTVTGGGHFLLQIYNSYLAIYDETSNGVITTPGSCDKLQANTYLTNNPADTVAGGGTCAPTVAAPAPWDDGWAEIEFCIDVGDDTIVWWVDGVEMGRFTNQTNLENITRVDWDNTYGGGANPARGSIGLEKRYIDHLRLAYASSGDC